MAQADVKPTAAKRVLEPHYSLTEEQHYTLQVVRRTLDCLSALTTVDERELQHLQVRPRRDELSALFELIRLQVESVIEGVEFLTLRDLTGSGSLQ